MTRSPKISRDYDLWLPLMLVSWWLAWKFQDPFISDWDGFDYTAYAVQGMPSALGLGRALFLGYNHLLWRILHHWDLIPHENAYLLLRYGAIAMSGPAVAGLYALGKELTASRLAAFCGALILALSPFYVMYSGRAMSEIPGFLLLNWSLWWMVRSLRLQRTGQFLLAATAVGLSANVREFAVFYFPFLLIAPRLYGFRWRMGIGAVLLAGSAAVAGMAFWLLKGGQLYWDAVTTWYRLSAHERELNPVTWKNLAFFGDYSYSCSVAVVFLTPIAMAMLWPRRELRPLLWLGLWGLLADLALIANHDLSVNPRYLLMGMTGLAPLCGWGLARIFHWEIRRGFALAAAIAILTLVNYVQLAREVFYQQRNAIAAHEYLKKVEAFPWNSGFIAGMRSPLINFYAGIEARPYWRTISPGAGWPDEKLGAAIEDLFHAGREVYVDFDPEIWQSGAREWSREAAGLEMIKQEYELIHVRDLIYQIKRKGTQR